MTSPLLSMILLSITACKGEPQAAEACVGIPDDATECPAGADVDVDVMYGPGWCGGTVTEVTGEGEMYGTPGGGDDTGYTGMRCCYPVLARDVDSGCVDGRPYREDGLLSTAEVRGELPPGGLARAWLEAARMEHASVASFARLTLDLMAVGAPLELLAQVQAAAAEEVVHARLTFELASRLAGTELSPGPFPFRQAVQPRTDLAAIAVDAVVEGCVGETLGAFLAQRVAEGLPQGEQRALLEQLAEDERRHAALSWGIVAWLIAEGGEPVRQAVIEALGRPQSVGGVVASLAGEGLEQLLRQGVDEVIQPAAEALLAA